MEIRKAVLSDISPCLRLQRSYKENYWTKKDFTRAVKDKSVIFLVAVEKREIIGSVIGFIAPTKRTDAMLHETRVSKNLQGKGVGTALVNRFCELAFKQGVKNVYALIGKQHVSFYVGACKFKKSADWIEVKRLKN